MKRKEVVVGNQVFDLGMKELEESVANKNGQWPTMELEVGDRVFQVGVLREEKTIVFNWWGMTEIINVVWTRFVFLRLGWPLFRKVECFTYAAEGI